MQSDLFNLSMSNSFERQAFQRSFFERKYTFRFDHILGFGIVLIIFFVMVFAWGAEHGKAVSHREMVREVAVPKAMINKSTDAIAKTPISIMSQTEASEPFVAVQEVLSPESTPATVNAPSSVEVASKGSLEGSEDTVLLADAKYTIAHVTYFKKDQADREMARLKKEGYAPILVSSGKYYQICINGFKVRKDANDALKHFRTKGIVSSDAYVRNMPVS